MNYELAETTMKVLCTLCMGYLFRVFTENLAKNYKELQEPGTNEKCHFDQRFTKVIWVILSFSIGWIIAGK